MTNYHTKTQEDYDALMIELEGQGIRWGNGYLPTECDSWGFYGKYTLIKLSGDKINIGSVREVKEGMPVTYYTATQSDPVNHPSHYKQGKQEVIEIIEEIVPSYPVEAGYHVGNAIKYIMRAPFKGKMKQDLGKAVWYLNRAIGLLDGVESEEVVE